MVLNVVFFHPSLGKIFTILTITIFRLGGVQPPTRYIIYIFFVMYKNNNFPLHPGWRLKWLDSHNSPGGGCFRSCVPLRSILQRHHRSFEDSESFTQGAGCRLGWVCFLHPENKKTLVVTKRREERRKQKIDVSVSFFPIFCLMLNMGKKLWIFSHALGFVNVLPMFRLWRVTQSCPPLTSRWKTRKH